MEGCYKIYIHATPGGFFQKLSPTKLSCFVDEKKTICPISAYPVPLNLREYQAEFLSWHEKTYKAYSEFWLSTFRGDYHISESKRYVGDSQC